MLTRRQFLLYGVALVSFASISQVCAQQVEEVTYLMPAPLNQVAFAPWLLAQQRGYYAQEGVKVNFTVVRGGVEVATQIGAGNAGLGGAFGDTPIIARSNGVPVKSVAVLGGRSMSQLAVHEGGGINSPKDLRGKTITVNSYADSGYYSLLGLLAYGGLTKNDVNAQAAGPTGVWQLFVAGKAQGMAAVPEWIVEAREKGAKVKIMPVYDYTRSMAQAILASDDIIRKRPDLVRKVTRATLRGLRDVMSDPQAVMKDYLAAMPTHKGREPFVLESFRLYNTYVYPGQNVVGTMDAERLAGLQKFYFQQGIIQKETPVNELYSNDFLR